MKSLVGIIGRPNVGKSSLFNRIIGRRAAITDDMPGVSRDRLQLATVWQGKQFYLVDTAGYDLKEEYMKKQMQEQVFMALQTAEVFILVVDGINGLHALDSIIVRMLFQQGKKFVVAVNKIDNTSREANLPEFYSLGVSELYPISASHGRGVDDLLDAVVDLLDDPDLPTDEEISRIKLSIVGRPNVGKSSLINSWLGENRVIVTPIAGTTRDAIDIEFSYNDENFLLIDTAGLRKKSVMFKDPIEAIGYHKSIDAIERSDVAVALLDAEEGLTDRDLKVIADAWEKGKPVVVVVNKWDLIEKNSETKKRYRQELLEKLTFMHNPPIIFISAITGEKVFKILQTAVILKKEAEKRISTSKVNEVLEEAISRHQPPIVHNRRLKFYYMTQVSVTPPQFVVFVNYLNAVHFSYQRFLINILREKFGFDGVPIKLTIRQRKGKRNEGVESGSILRKRPKTHKKTKRRK